MAYLTSLAWGNTSQFILTEHGMDAHDWDPACEMYTYGPCYCVPYCSHPGMDITMDAGTTLYAIGGGVITCAGTGIGSGYDGAGCAAYEDTIHGGVGRLELLLDSGQVAIYGHSMTASVSVGQHVTTGTPIGSSGGMNSDHLHFELREPNSGCDCDYAAIDPTGLLTGAVAPVTNFEVTDTVSVSASGGANLRTAPNLTTSTVITLMPLGRKAIVLSGPTLADGYKWYYVETRHGRGYVAGELLQSTSLSNILVNSTANTDLTGIYANRADTSNDIFRDAMGGTKWRVRVWQDGLLDGQGVRYESANNLGWTGQRYFGAYLSDIRKADASSLLTLNTIRTTIFYTDGTSQDGTSIAYAPTNSWEKIVLRSVASNPAKTIRKVALRATGNDLGTAYTFYTDNARIVEL